MGRKFAVGVLVGILIVAGLAASFVAWGFYRNSRLDRQFEAVTVGASDAQVRNLLGRPSWSEPCGKSFGTPKPNCTEYLYRNSFAPLVPEYYSVKFDSNSRVIDKYVYESP